MTASKIITHAGRRAQALGLENGDAAQTRDCGTYKVCVLCDGAGSCTHGAEAAQLVSAVMADYLAENFRRAMTEPEEVIRREATLAVAQAVSQKAAALACGEEALGCTILAAAMDENGRFCFFHLGDGCILGRLDEDCDWMCFSYPQRGLNGGTYLTGKTPIFEHLHFGRAVRRANSSLFLMTDGFAEILNADRGLLSHPERLGPGASAEDDWSAAWLSAAPFPEKSRPWLVYPEETDL